MGLSKLTGNAEAGREVIRTDEDAVQTFNLNDVFDLFQSFLRFALGHDHQAFIAVSVVCFQVSVAAQGALPKPVPLPLMKPL